MRILVQSAPLPQPLSLEFTQHSTTLPAPTRMTKKSIGGRASKADEVQAYLGIGKREWAVIDAYGRGPGINLHLPLLTIITARFVAMAAAVDLVEEERFLSWEKAEKDHQSKVLAHQNMITEYMRQRLEDKVPDLAEKDLGEVSHWFMRKKYKGYCLSAGKEKEKVGEGQKVDGEGPGGAAQTRAITIASLIE